MSIDKVKTSKFDLQYFLSAYSVRTRILTTILVPVIGLLFVGFQELKSEYQDYVEAGHMSQLAEITPVISSLTHEMQKERGMSAGFISSNGEKFASELIVQRSATDAVLEEFRASAESALQAGLDAEITEEFTYILSSFEKLDTMRTDIDNFQMPKDEMTAYFTGIITEFIVTVELQISLANEPAIGRQLQALFFLMEAKEYSGIERAVGAGAFSTGELDLAGYTKFVGVVKLQDFFAHKFENLGGENLVSIYRETFRGPIVERVDAYRDLMRNAPFGGSLAAVSGEEWFDATTDRINLFKMIDDEATTHIVEAAGRIEAAAAQKLQLVILINTVILFATIVLAFLVVRSITGPIIRLTSTMDTLAGGNYDTEVAGTKNKDELGDMARAVEIFRENGLKIQQFEKDTERQLITAADHSGQISAIGKAQAVIEFTATGIITNANENFLKTTGYSIDEIKGQHHSMFVEPQYAKSADYKAFWQKLGKGEYEEGEYERFDKNGTRVWLQASYNPIFGPDGELTKVVKYASNITPRKEATAVLGSSLKLLAEGDLNSSINSPLSGEFEDVREAFNGTIARLTEIVGQLRETSGGLKVATGEILEGANDLSERTTKQAATIEETSATMEQLATTVAENARTAENASAKSGTVSQVAQEGGQVMVEANKAMERITQSSSKISNIIGMIDDIAFQTNLLALNASVEAARAGEAGKGFAVVAVEVRRLAQSAAEASSEVKTLIEQSADEVSNGSKLVADAAEKLDVILEGVRESGSLIDDIARDSKEQAASIDEVNVAVRQMDEMTQHNAALVEETNAAIEQTEVQARELDNIVDVFKVGDTAPNLKRQSDVSIPRQSPKDAKRLTETTSKAAASYHTSGTAALDTDWGEF